MLFKDISHLELWRPLCTEEQISCFLGYLTIKFVKKAIVFKGKSNKKALTCKKFFLYKQKLIFIKETNTFGHIVV